MFTPIAGKSLVVTGGSKGIGRGIARVFAQQGARVLLTGRHETTCQAVVEEITSAGGTAAFIAGDVASEADMHAMAERAIELYGGIEILCANAGISPRADIDQMTHTQWRETIDINLTGSFLASQACLPSMLARGRGRIILTSSITGPVTAIPALAHYAASKAGQLGLMRGMALDLAQKGITVNAILPGNILTEMVTESGDDYIRSMTATIPMKAMGTVEDIAHAALYFASDEAAYVTGQTLVVDGGQVLPEALTD